MTAIVIVQAVKMRTMIPTIAPYVKLQEFAPSFVERASPARTSPNRMVSTNIAIPPCSPTNGTLPFNATVDGGFLVTRWTTTPATAQSARMNQTPAGLVTHAVRAQPSAVSLPIAQKRSASANLQ